MFVAKENQKNEYGKNLETKAGPFLILSLTLLRPQEVALYFVPFLIPEMSPSPSSAHPETKAVTAV